MLTGDSSFVTCDLFCAGHFRISVSRSFFHPPAQMIDFTRLAAEALLGPQIDADPDRTGQTHLNRLSGFGDSAVRAGTTKASGDAMVNRSSWPRKPLSRTRCVSDEMLDNHTPKI